MNSLHLVLIALTAIALGAIFATGVDLPQYKTELAVALTVGLISVVGALLKPKIDKRRSHEPMRIVHQDFRRVEPASRTEWFLLTVILFYGGLILYTGISITYLL